MADPDFRDLVSRLKASDHDAFKIIFDASHQSIFNFLHYKTKDAQLAEDLLQDVFLKFWNARQQLDEKHSIRNYLYTIADNLALNQIRHLKVISKHQQETEVKNFSAADNPQYVLEEKEWRNRVQQAIDMLPEKTRIIFLMSRIEDLSYQSIADRLSISIKTVETHMTKALRLLRESLKKNF
jgi:RNA polymerase sigma-70 factor (family 1)